MDLTGIRDTIRSALREEEESHALRDRLQRELPQLREKLVLPDEEPVSALMGFIVRYVNSVPSCLRLVTAVSKRLGFFEYAAPFLQMAEDFFLAPPDELSGDSGLEALLDEAFLAHRLLEEVNDHHIRHLQRPLLPLDMTEANIIVHHLLGDELANRLDQLVQFAARQLLGREHIWEEVKALPGAGESSPPILSSANLESSAGRIRLRLAS